MQYRPELVATSLVAAFWLACAWRLTRLWLRTRGSTNGVRALLVALGQLAAVRGAEIVYVAVVWMVPLERRAGDMNIEHSVKAGYILLNFAGILAVWHLVTVWQGKR